MEKEEKSHKKLKIIAIIIILLVSLFLYGKYLNTKGLKIKEVAVYNSQMSSDYNGLKIAQFSDVHYGRTTHEKDLKKVVSKLNKMHADIVIFTGDLFDQANFSEQDKEIVSNELKNIQAKLFKFAVIGDYDQKYLEQYKEILEASGFILLDNLNYKVYYNSLVPINFVGITSYEEKVQTLYDSDFNISLMHEPDKIKDLTKTNVAFAGHSLGGQIVIPFIGGIIKQDGARTYLESHYKINDAELYISNGIGTQKFSFRLFNKPSITLYRLYQS